MNKMQVFISHASADRDLADRLSGKLRDAGIDVWDPSSIFPGDNWALETGNALAQSEVMVVLYTKNAREIATLSQDVQSKTAFRARSRASGSTCIRNSGKRRFSPVRRPRPPHCKP
ncbi:MAG: hypothetical protein B7Z73_19535 [Planctomycetia bacterium 21-64-5]|nr:MAG: hypothetical protein B7Z73_19535 [Planctomycetia bacterium 21-64-5]